MAGASHGSNGGGHACLAGAFAGAVGPVCVGVTFLPSAAIDSLAWGGEREQPLLTAVCSRLRPDFAFVPSWEVDATRTCEAVAACGTAPLWVVRGPFDAVASSEGWRESISATIADPARLDAQLDAAVGEARASIREATACGVAGVVIAEDVAGADGPLLSPDYIISEIVPRLGRIAVAAAEEGLPVIWHTDGDPRPFIAAAARVGLDAIHPGGLGAEQFGQVFAAAREHGLAVLGGIPGEALRAGGPAVVRAGIGAGVLAAGGGLLVCDDGGVSTGEELGMLVVALQAARGPAQGGRG